MDTVTENSKTNGINLMKDIRRSVFCHCVTHPGESTLMCTWSVSKHVSRTFKREKT